MGQLNVKEIMESVARIKDMTREEFTNECQEKVSMITTLLCRVIDILEDDKAFSAVTGFAFVGCLVSAGSADVVDLYGGKGGIEIAIKSIMEEYSAKIKDTRDKNAKEDEKD